MDFKHFIGGSYESQAVTADQELTINWYPEILESEGATRPMALYPTPGVETLATQFDGAGRGHFAMDGREFLIIGDFLWEADAAGDLTSRGSFPNGLFLDSDIAPATISSSGDAGNELFITVSNSGYIYNLGSNTFTTVPAGLVGNATMGGYMDGYFLALDASTATLYISNLFDGTTWDTGTDFAQRNLAPDRWISMKVFGRYVWLFGGLTTELWQDTGDRFPFAPIPNALINYGIAAPWSVQIVDNTIVWLAQNDAGRICVVRSTGQNVEIISTYAVELAISGYPDFADAVSDSYSDQGHSFYMLNFDASGVTLTWDASTGLWHQRGTWNTTTNAFTSWRPRYHQFAFGQHRILDSLSGFTPNQIGGGTIPSRLYRMGTDLTSDVGDIPIRRVRRAPALQAENRRVFYSNLELDLEPGLGLSTGQGSDPQVMLRLSNDGGKTWGAEMMRSAGKIGEYETRVRWNRLGSARRRVFEVSVSDPIPWRLTGAYLNVLGEGAARG